MCAHAFATRVCTRFYAHATHHPQLYGIINAARARRPGAVCRSPVPFSSPLFVLASRDLSAHPPTRGSRPWPSQRRLGCAPLLPPPRPKPLPNHCISTSVPADETVPGPRNRWKARTETVPMTKEATIAATRVVSPTEWSVQPPPSSPPGDA